MCSNIVLILALRYFYAKKNEKFLSIISAISLIGITIGVAALVIVMSVMNGFHIELTANIIGLNGDISVTPCRGCEMDYAKTKEVVAKNDFVRAIVPSILGQSLAIGLKNNSGVLVRGINYENLIDKEQILSNIVAGNFDLYDSGGYVVIGVELARNLGIWVGDKVKLFSPTTLPTAFGSIPRAKEFKVAAIFRSAMFDYDAITVLMPRSVAQKLFALNSDVNLLEVYIKKQDDVAKYSQSLQQQLGKEVYVKSWIQSNQQFLNALSIERSAMFLILSLIIIVAAFNIVSSLFMLVKDKTKDIAILRTIGASSSQVMLVFISTGMIIGTIGTFLGVGLGALFASNIDVIRQAVEHFSGIALFDPAIYFLYNLPSVVQISDIVYIAVLSLSLSLLATLYPAYRASRLNPVEAMRYE
jgi:lipoprotein-releasing system permease protein